MTDMKSLEPPDYPNADWCFFRDNPERCYYARLASSAELDRIRTHANIDNLAPDCFVYCLARLDRQAAQLQQLYGFMLSCAAIVITIAARSERYRRASCNFLKFGVTVRAMRLWLCMV